jgi:hypothetical protein
MLQIIIYHNHHPFILFWGIIYCFSAEPTLNLAEITVNLCVVIFYIWSRFHIPSSSDSLVITVKVGGMKFFFA